MRYAILLSTTRKGKKMISYKATYLNKSINHTAEVKGKARSLDSAIAEETRFINSRNENGGDFVLVSVVKA